MVNIAVTYSADEDQREILRELLANVARLIFLADLSTGDRAKELAMADLLISLNPVRELKPEEFGMIGKARLMQLLTAGADHMPFSRLPSNLMVASNVGAYAEPIAEHVLAMVLASEKHLMQRHDELRKGKFDHMAENRMLRGSVSRFWVSAA